MAKPRKYVQIRCRFFLWRLVLRNGAYYADGRSNAIKLGRFSLGTKNEAEARSRLDQLDLKMAVKNGKADASLLRPNELKPLGLEDGFEKYKTHVGRSRMAGGARPRTIARYKAVMDGVREYARIANVRVWNGVNKNFLNGYIRWRDDEGYAQATLYLEGTWIKQAVKYFVTEGLLPKDSEIRLHLERPKETTTYCWTADEVAAMIAHCRATDGLEWLATLIVSLCYTGMRISEIVDLRWGDLDFTGRFIQLVDEESTRSSKHTHPTRTTKSGRNRSFPMHPEVFAELSALPRHKDGYVFHGPLDGRLKADVVRRALVRDVLKPLAGRFGSGQGSKSFADGRLHSFRHFFCSLCANRGVPERMLMDWLGHTNAEMVRRYYHADKGESRRQMAKVLLSENETGGAAAG